VPSAALLALKSKMSDNGTDHQIVASTVEEIADRSEVIVTIDDFAPDGCPAEQAIASSSFVEQPSSDNYSYPTRASKTAKKLVEPFTFRQHSREILNLTLPIIASEIFQNTLPIVDLIFVGRLGKDELAAAALATVWFNLWDATMLGFCTAIDTLLSQAYGADQFDIFAMWTGNSMIVVMCMTVLMAGLVALCSPIMILFGQDPNLSAAAGQFSYRLIPGLFPYYAFKVLVKHLQTQDILLPGIMIGLVANGINVFANWFLIFAIDMGLDGAPVATTLTRFIEFILIAAYFFWKRDTVLAKTWPTFAPGRMLQRNEGKVTVLSTFMRLAGSGAMSFSAEAWSFEVTTILAGLLGTVALDAHIITLSIATFLYLSFPFAISIAVSIKVGQLIGEDRPEDARRSSLVSFVLTVIVQATLIIIVLPSSEALGRIFSSNEDVSQLVAELLPLSCIFMMGDCFHSTTGGVMRGLGRQKLVFLLNVVGFWILAVPIGALLTFVAGIGVKGLWWGMSIGIYSSALIGLTWLKFRIGWKKETAKAQQRISVVQDLHASVP
jgi:MATE family multidrug resistance protein